MLSSTPPAPLTSTRTHTHPSFHFITLCFCGPFIILSQFYFFLCFPVSFHHALFLVSSLIFSPLSSPLFLAPSRPSISTAGWVGVSPGWRTSTPPTRRTTTCSRASSWPRRSSKQWTAQRCQNRNVAESHKQHKLSLSIFSQQTWE